MKVRGPDPPAHWKLYITTVSPPHRQIPNRGVQDRFELHVSTELQSIEKNPCISRPEQFKSMFFKGQLYISQRLWLDIIARHSSGSKPKTVKLLETKAAAFLFSPHCYLSIYLLCFPICVSDHSEDHVRCFSFRWLMMTLSALKFICSQFQQQVQLKSKFLRERISFTCLSQVFILFSNLWPREEG